MTGKLVVGENWVRGVNDTEWMGCGCFMLGWGTLKDAMLGEKENWGRLGR